MFNQIMLPTMYQPQMSSNSEYSHLIPPIGGNITNNIPGLNPNFTYPYYSIPMPSPYTNYYKHNQTIINPSIKQQPIKTNNLTSTISNPVDFKVLNIEHLNSLEDDLEKKDYLGGILYSNIENNDIIKKKEFSSYIIGKITGMILGIDDMNEKIEICEDINLLNDNINEALMILKESNYSSEVV